MNKRKNECRALLVLAVMLIWLCSITVQAEGASGDNSLSSLGIITEGVTVSPEFYYSTIEYNVTVPAGTTRLELEPVTSNSNAWIVGIEGQDLVNGETTVKITVSAENGSQYAYYLYVEEEKSADPSASAPGVQVMQPIETEPETEETEPQTEDPRYVKVDREAMEAASATIEKLKTEAGSYRDRMELLMKILYGMIGFCVILLFVVINLLLKKKDLNAELRNYRGYGYPTNPSSEKKRAAAEEYERQKPQAPQPQQDDPMTVPKPSKAKKQAKRMPEYEKAQQAYDYEPKTEHSDKDVEVTMIDL